MLGIPRGVAVRPTERATTFPAGGDAPKAGTTAQDLHKAMMGGNRTLQSTVMEGNEFGGATGTRTGKVAAPEAGQQQCAGKGSMGWSALT